MRQTAIVCGREIGTYDGWDELETCDIVLHEFKSDYTAGLPEGDLNIDFNKGLFRQYDDDGNVTFEQDLVETLNRLVRAPNDLA